MKKTEKIINEIMGGARIVDFPKEKISIMFEENDFFEDDYRIGTLYCFHRQYNLGDDHSFETPKELEDFIKKSGRTYLPLYLYDHSGLRMSTTPFSCPWDSGQVGYIVANKKTIDDLDDDENAIKEWLRHEVEKYDAYLNAAIEVVSILDENDDIVDSVCVGVHDTLKDVVEGLLKEYNLLDSECTFRL